MTAVSNIIATFASVIVATLLLSRGTQADPAAELTKQETPCKSAHYLIKLAAAAEGKLKSLLEKTTEEVDEHRALEVYAATADTGAANAAVAGLSEYASRRTATLARAAVTCAQAVSHLTRTLNIEAGKNWALASATEITSTTGTAQAMSNTGQGQSVSAHLKLDKLTADSCAKTYTTTAAQKDNDPDARHLEAIRIHKLEGKTTADTAAGVCQVACVGAACSTAETNIKVSSAAATLFKAGELAQLAVENNRR
uniref:Variant surface glycoprotein 1914 n=1 Tax=Trypanosoma brucei TaxID=5691 RepID=M4SXM6_9TRYP|nr:variant surface glycoprotein 1914 [Trypanosoma brucei]